MWSLASGSYDENGDGELSMEEFRTWTEKFGNWRPCSTGIIAEISWAHKKGSLVQNKWFASWDVISFFSSLIWCFFIDLTGHFRFAGSVRPSRRGVFSRRQYDIWNPQVRAIFAKSWTWTMTFLVLLEDHMTWKTWLNYQADPSGGLVVESSAQMALFLPVFFF